MSESLLLLLMSVLLLPGHVIITDGATLRPELTGPSMAFLKSTVTFECKLSESPSPLTFELIKGNDEVLAINDNPITFPLKVNKGSEGEYFCRVTARNQTSTSNPVYLQVVIPVQGVSLVPEPNPAVIYEGAGFNMSCEASKGTHLTYSWYHNKQKVMSPSPLHHFAGNTLTVDRAAERHAGSYLCVAENMMGNNSRASSSRPVTVVVKKYLSAPRLSFTLFYNGSSYYANISCRLAYGSPPVTFQLLLNGKRVDVQQVDFLEAWFSQPVTVGLDMGRVQCIAENNIQQLLSNSIDLEVVPVTGPAHVQVEYLYRADSAVAAALLQCVITMGTFPIFSWSFNGSTLPLEANSPTFIQHEQVLVLTHISPGNSGYYSCRVRDSFNSNSSWVESEEVLVKMTDLTIFRTSTATTYEVADLTTSFNSASSTTTDVVAAFEVTQIEVTAVVFCCFLFVMIVGGAGCLFQNINPERETTDNYHHGHCHEHFNTEYHHAMPETVFEPHVEEMETVFMEVEV
ncbi:hypothetical protein PHYPO_G00022870 [Pangasianodon hypophthalmus]|uniref:Ig-like domain-containing protein n=1 Tax=Pangasianodon hypophthalmus TaxID=310915 RepID=A0A5N5MV98_PANHP|nr:Fc receptor-like protein 5 isoform X1 [Pangasianodon hypophthalmus]KAB5558929.1 hypothetical protein PHYPO_G00022870 [Pangasianodon hypophthalmus]